jgi:ribonuclease P protein component
MLAKENRIKKKKDFDKLFKKAKSIKTNNFILKILSNSLKKNRFGFIISQKVAKKAVKRNKIRRNLAVVAKKITNKIKSGTDIVVIALCGIIEKKQDEIEAEIKKVLEKNKIINNV